MKFNRKELLWVMTGILFITLAAQFSISPEIAGAPVPITGQSLAVLVVACLLGSKNGTVAVFIYLLIGALGLPVFADGESGIGKITGPGGGYLIGFLVAAYLVGLLAERLTGRSFLRWLGLMTLGTAMILLCGWLRLSLTIGAEKAFTAGILPYLPGAVLKIFIGALLVWNWQRFVTTA